MTTLRFPVGVKIAFGAIIGAAACMSAVPAPAEAAQGTPPALRLAVCPAGTDLVLPSATVISNDGWVDMEYDFAGVEVWESIPPSGSDVSLASDDVLLQHHLPTRPEAAADVPSWAKAISFDLASRVRGRCVMPGLSFSGSYDYSTNWGGDEVRAQSSYSFYGVRAFIQQPSYGSSCDANRALGSWVGLGGDPGTSPLIQVGTMALGPGWGVNAGYHSFWEFIYPAQHLNVGPTLMSVTPQPGDTVWESLQLYGSGPSRYAYVWISDGSQSDSAAITIGTAPVTGDAEWIDERATAQPMPDLPNYGWTMWTQMAVLRSNSSSWTAAYNEPTEWWVQMYDSGYLSKTTGTYSDSHMRNHWYACHGV